MKKYEIETGKPCIWCSVMFFIFMLMLVVMSFIVIHCYSKEEPKKDLFKVEQRSINLTNTLLDKN